MAKSTYPVTRRIAAMLRFALLLISLLPTIAIAQVRDPWIDCPNAPFLLKARTNSD